MKQSTRALVRRFREHRIHVLGVPPSRRAATAATYMIARNVRRHKRRLGSKEYRRRTIAGLPINPPKARKR